MSLGSSDEMQVILELCHDLGYITEDIYTRMTRAYEEISKMLNGLIKATKAEQIG